MDGEETYQGNQGMSQNDGRPDRHDVELEAESKKEVGHLKKTITDAMALNWVLRHPQLHNTGKMVFRTIWSLWRLNKRKGCYASNRYIGRENGIRRRQARRWINKLEEFGFVKIKRKHLKDSHRKLFVNINKIAKAMSSMTMGGGSSMTMGEGHRRPTPRSSMTLYHKSNNKKDNKRSITSDRSVNEQNPSSRNSRWKNLEKYLFEEDARKWAKEYGGELDIRGDEILPAVLNFLMELDQSLDEKTLCHYFVEHVSHQLPEWTTRPHGGNYEKATEGDGFATYLNRKIEEKKKQDEELKQGRERKRLSEEERLEWKQEKEEKRLAEGGCPKPEGKRDRYGDRWDTECTQCKQNHPDIFHECYDREMEYRRAMGV